MLKKHAVYLFVLLPLVICSPPARASTDIDVVVAIAPEVYDLENAALAAGQLEIFMTSTLISSGILGKRMRFRSLIPPALYPHGDSGSGAEALSFIRSGADPLLKAARDSGSLVADLGSIPAFDLVVLIVERLVKKDNNGNIILKPDGSPAEICGSASLFYDSTFGLSPMNPLNSNRKFAVAISLSCEDSLDKVIAHEMGHIFGGDHQVDSVYSPDTNDTQLSFPNDAAYNHPVFYESGTSPPTGILYAASAMFGQSHSSVIPQYSTSTPSRTLIGTGFDAGNSTESNMVRVIEQTWENVAAYRPIAPPQDSYRVYWQPFCWGSWDTVFSLNAVYSSGAISYRPSASLWLCWAVAVIGGE